MSIVDTLFRRFKDLAAAAEKARESDPSKTSQEDDSPSTTKSKLAETVLEIQKMERQQKP